MDPDDLTLDRLAVVRRRVAAATARSGRTGDAVRLIAVSKGRTVSDIATLFEEGQRDFGENRAQEFAAKAPLLSEAVRWHFVGPLQRNKVNKVRPLTALLHSMDRERLAVAWAAPDAPPALLEVNIGGEVQKHGVAPADAEAAAAAIIAAGVDLRGLMTVAPLAADAEAVRPIFATMRRLQARLAERWPSIVDLSMGMTDDFEVAIEEGATLVRVGRAIFGPTERPQR